MPHDPNGLINRWSGSARRGTLLNIGYALAALAALVAIAIVLHKIIG